MPSSSTKRLRVQLLLLLLLVAVSLVPTGPTSAPGVADLRFHPALRPTLPAGSLLVGATPSQTALAPGAPSPRAAFEALQARSAAPLGVAWDAVSGVPTYLAPDEAQARLPYTPTAAELGNPAAIARGFLDENRALFGLRSVADDLRLLRVEPDPRLGYHHVRLEQVYAGIPVWGRQLVVHLDADEQITAVNGELRPALDLPTQPTLSAARAHEVALRELLEVQLEPEERARVSAEVLADRTRLMVYVDGQGRATLTWLVTVMTTSPLGQWRVFVHARRPAVVHAFDSLSAARQRRTYTARGTTRIPGQLLIQEGERSRNEIAQAAHDGAGVVYDYYFESFQRDSIDGRGMPIVSTVNFGSDPQDAENAAWIGEAQQMIYGDGGEIFRPLPFGLDVVAHELTHGVIDNTAQLIYEGQSGALNESYADVFGALIDSDNWTMGEEVVKSPPFPAPVLRSLEDPTLGGLYDPRNPLAGIGQPRTMDEFARLPLSRRADNGGVHINSGIPNHVAFLVGQALGREKMGQIYYRTMTQYLTPSSDFADAARLTIRAAQELYGASDAAAVRGAFAEVGINAAADEVGPEPPPASGEPNLPTGPGGQPPGDQAPAGCSELVVNGGFENDDAWVQLTAGETAILDTELPYTGRRSAWLGGIDTEPLQYIYQDIRIPANATTIELGYWRLVHYETRGVLGILAEEAYFSALIANTSGDVLGAVEEIASSEGDDTWRRASFDVSELGGKTIRLSFVAENPRNNISSMFVDDVSLVACTTGSAPQAPSAGGNQVYLQGVISDADTGRGISGAQLFFLRPGLSASQAAADDTISGNEVLTIATTDREGIYQSEEPVPRGQVYSVIILARGYRPIVADDGLEVPSNAENPLRADAEMRRGR